MKAKDLRIGSTILFDGKIAFANTRIIAYINNSERLKNGDSIAFEPIPLTEDWLLKFGFEKVGVNYQKGWLLLWTYLKTGEVHFVLNEPNSNKRHITELKYVHQLENLYFALEGSELTFSNNA